MTTAAAAVRLPTARNLIGGQWLDDAAARRRPVHDPATEQVLGDIPCSTEATVDAAVQAAKAAFANPAWAGLAPIAREGLLHRLANLIDEHASELAAIESLDNGKPIAFSSTVDVPLSAMWVRYMAGWPTKLSGRSIAPALQPAGTHHAYTLRQPVGVVAAIVPWTSSMLGPVVSARQLDSVLGKIQAGVAAGAEVVFGGSRVDRPGYFVEPTVLLTSDRTNPAYREEVFGPVLTATPYDNPDELAALANDSDYGLAAHIYTRDLAAAHQLAQRIDAGTVWVNTQLSPDPAIPFGGFKQSGWGRENGEDVFAHYTETKSVIMKVQ